MKTQLLFDNVAANQAQTSSEVPFEQRSEWMLYVSKSGTDGNPNLIIEYSVDNNPGAGDWAAVINPETLTTLFPLDDSPIAIIDDRLQGKYFRIRLEPNGTTTGTVKADLGFKTYP